MTTAKQDLATHAARRQSELDRIAAMTPEQRQQEQAAFLSRIAALDEAKKAEQKQRDHRLLYQLITGHEWNDEWNDQ